MINRLLIVVAAALFSPKSAAEELAKNGQPAPALQETSDVQDLLFMGDRRPVRIRLHISVAERPFPAAWNDYMRSVFDFADVNGDGLLSKEEAKRIPSAEFLGTLMAGAFSLQTTKISAPFAELDADGNGKVTLAEMKAYYRKAGQGPLQLQSSPTEGTSQALTDALFKALDRDKDGQLSKTELEQAEESLRPLDVDEDEWITPEKLLPNLNGAPPTAPSDKPIPGKSRVADFVLLSPDEPPKKIAEKLTAHYAKVKGKGVSRAELGFDEPLFTKLDADKDGRLDIEELAKWFAEPPDLEFRIFLGQTPDVSTSLGKQALEGPKLGISTPIDLWNTADLPMPLAKGVQKTAEGSVTVKLGNALIEMQREGTPVNKFAAVRRFYIQQFQGARGDKEHLDAEQAKENTFLAGIFELADRNGDGKLTQNELEAFLDVQTKGTHSFTTVSLADHGYGLFELLDANHDNRLSPRELKGAWRVLESWDTDKDGFITQKELPRQFQLTLSQGLRVGNARFAVVGAPRSRFDSLPASGKKGPVWFRKMDKNGDGDVSRREFLGSDEDFRRIDTDGNGLIDVEEAERADARLRGNRLPWKTLGFSLWFLIPPTSLP